LVFQRQNADFGVAVKRSTRVVHQTSRSTLGQINRKVKQLNRNANDDHEIKIRAAFLLVLLVLTLAACSRKTPVAVRVGEQQLTMDELATLFRNSPHYIRAHEFQRRKIE
jgi:hypothetical protein